MSSFLNELGNPYYAIVDDKDGYQSIKLEHLVPNILIDKKKEYSFEANWSIGDNIYFKFLAILKMKYVFFILVCIISLDLYADQKIDTKVIEISKNLRCLVCQGQSINDSDSDFALDVKKLVKKSLEDGKTDKEIYSYLKLKYGDWILYKTPFNLRTIFLWLLPIIIILIGMKLILRRTKFE